MSEAATGIKFYVLPQGQTEPKGPYTVEEIAEHIRRGWLARSAQVAVVGQQEWRSVTDVPPLAAALAAAPPPPVPGSAVQAPRPKKSGMGGGEAVIAVFFGLFVLLGVLGFALVLVMKSGGSSSAASSSSMPSSSGDAGGYFDCMDACVESGVAAFPPPGATAEDQEQIRAACSVTTCAALRSE